MMMYGATWGVMMHSPDWVLEYPLYQDAVLQLLWSQENTFHERQSAGQVRLGKY
jgi:hypothetical protein